MLLQARLTTGVVNSHFIKAWIDCTDGPYDLRSQCVLRGSEDRDRDDLIKLHVAQAYKCEQSDSEHSSVECSERRHQLYY